MSLDGTPVLNNVDIIAEVDRQGTMKEWSGITEPDGTIDIDIDFTSLTMHPLSMSIDIIDPDQLS